MRTGHGGWGPRFLFGAAAIALATAGALCADPAPDSKSAGIAPGTPVEIKTLKGDLIKGTFIEQTPEGVVLDHPILGRVTLPDNSLEQIIPPPPPPPEVKWEGYLDAGVAGSEGNTEQFDLRFGAGARRTSKTMETRIDLRYLYGSDDGETSKNEGTLDFRNDWTRYAPWRIWMDASAEYDEFQNWDWRVASHGGIGYEVIKNERTLLLPRIGAGAYREFGGDDNDLHPEGVLGVDFTHRFAKNHGMGITLDFYPALENFGDYRFVGKAFYEILMSADRNLWLKLGVEDRYDSTPNGAKRNDLDYFATVTLKF